MQVMAAASGRQVVGLLLLLLVVAVPTARAQGRSKIRIVECINESIGNISSNLGKLREIATTTTTTRGPTTTLIVTTTKTATTTQEATTTQKTTTTVPRGAIFRKLQSLNQEQDKGSWLTLDAINFAVPELFENETLILCSNNTNCAKVVSALDAADAITEEVKGDNIYEALVDRIYQADADVVAVVFEAPKDQELLEILLENIEYFDKRIETLNSDKAAMQDLQDKMKSKEKLILVFGLIAGVVAFVGLTAAGYACYQKTRKDSGVPEGLIIE